MARNLNRIRAALGEEKTSFLGYSYGSALGAAHASMFPQRADRIVLDSNIGDTHLDQDGMRRYALGAEETFPDFAKWAAARHETYGLGRTPEQVRKTYFTLAKRLDQTPENGIDGRLFRLATFAGLFGKTRYGFTAQAWQSVRDGDEAAVARLAAAAALTDNQWSVFLAVTCNDVDWPSDVRTPHRGGELLDDKFGDRSRLVSVNGSGHCVYIIGDNACALNTTTSFLVDGKLPKHDMSCT